VTEPAVLAWGLVTLFLAVTTLVAVATSFHLYDWRRQLLSNPLVVAPDGISLDIEKIQKELVGLRAEVTNGEKVDTDDLMKKLGEVQSVYIRLQDSLDRRDEEVARLRRGYDQHLIRNYLRRFIKVDQALREELVPDDRTWAGVESVLDLLADAFDECGLERFEPPLASQYRNEPGVADNPTTVPTNDELLVGSVAEVLEAGYRLRTDAGNSEVLVDARVAVYVEKGR
jgi:molecular chaperone GrpE (heat shock protein)